jgi:amino acid permease
MIFFIVFGDTAGGIFKKIGFQTEILSSRVFTHCLLGVLLLYLTLKKDLKSLRYSGIVILIFIGVFLILFVLHFFISNPDPEKKVKHSEMNFTMKTIEAIPTFLTIYAFHVTFFSALLTLKNPTDNKGLCAFITSSLIVFSVYIISPLIAFELYGEDVGTNMLKNVSDEPGVLPTILQVLFLIIAVMHIPVVFYIGKENVLIAFDQLTRGSYTQKETKLESKRTQDMDKNQNPDLEAQNSESNGAHHSSVENSPKHSTNKNETKEETSKAISVVKSNPKAYLGMNPVFYYLITLFCFLLTIVTSIIIGDVAIYFK